MTLVIDCENIKWDEYCKKMPIEKQDIYFTRQYYCMGQKVQGGNGKLFVYEDENGNIGLYPFIKREVICPENEKKYYDIETAYGYGGPIIKEEKPQFVRAFESAFLQYCQKESIIAEFVRFHPLLKNEHVFIDDIQAVHNRSTVWLDLDTDIENIWMNDISAQNRNTIRKGTKNGLRVVEQHDYSKFMELYIDTMRNVGADKFYYFEESYFDEMENSKEYILLEVKYESRTIAAAVFMGYGNYFHYHLAGSDKNFLKLAPNNVLLWEAIKYAKEHGYKKMHFGGGLTDSLDDSLFRFKQRFSSTYADFYIGKRIHNKEVYDSLIRSWEEKHGRKASLLLQYRE